MSAPSTSGLSVALLLRVIDDKYGCFTLLYFIPSSSLFQFFIDFIKDLLPRAFLIYIIPETEEK